MKFLIKPHSDMSNSSSRPTGTPRTGHFHFSKAVRPFLTDFNQYKMLQPVSVAFQKTEKVRQGNFVQKLCEIHLLTPSREARNIPGLIFLLFSAIDFQDIKAWESRIFFYTMHNLSLGVGRVK